MANPFRVEVSALGCFVYHLVDIATSSQVSASQIAAAVADEANLSVKYWVSDDQLAGLTGSFLVRVCNVYYATQCVDMNKVSMGGTITIRHLCHTAQTFKF